MPRAYIYDFIRQGRSRVFNTLTRGIVKGTLIVVDDDGTYSFGQPASKETSPIVTMHIHNPCVWTRIILSSDLGGWFHAYTTVCVCAYSR